MTDSGWWDAIEEPEAVERKAERLANILARMYGTREEHVRWLIANIPLMESECEADGIDAERQPRQFGGKMKSLAIRWWQNEVKRMPSRVEVYRAPAEPRIEFTPAEREEQRAFAARTKAGIRRVS